MLPKSGVGELEYPTRGQAWLKESRAGHLKFLVRGTKIHVLRHFQNCTQTLERRGGGQVWLTLTRGGLETKVKDL